jgi:hypothetical protein
MPRIRIPDETPKVRTDEKVRRIRDRYAIALSLGYPVKEAAALAQGDGSIGPPAPSAVEDLAAPKPVIVEGNKAVAEPEPPPKIASVRQSSPAVMSLDNLAPHWQEDLPWPQIRELARNVSGGRAVNSRRVAIEVIEAALDQTSAGLIPPE